MACFRYLFLCFCDTFLFMEIKHILFDLDNTLYPATSAMDKGITTRMYECIMDFFGISLEEAIELRKEKIVHFSTTLEWLRNEGMRK